MQNIQGSLVCLVSMSSSNTVNENDVLTLLHNCNALVGIHTITHPSTYNESARHAIITLLCFQMSKPALKSTKFLFLSAWAQGYVRSLI